MDWVFVSILIWSALLLTLIVLVGLRLDGNPALQTVSWMVVLSPLLALSLSLVLFVAFVLWRLPRNLTMPVYEQHYSDDPHRTDGGYRLCSLVAHYVLLVLFAVFLTIFSFGLAAKLDGI